MGRKQHRRRPSEDHDHRQQGRAISPENDQGRGQRGTAGRKETLVTRMSGTRNRYQGLAVCALLLLAVGLVFGQTVRHEFVNYDDDQFVYENPHVAPGLTGHGMVWAFTHFEGHYWIPLTRISSMLDCQLYGLSAGGHHLTNVLLHAATTILLFLIFWRMTGGLWPSALLAALFAVHPLHVESVAWVTERKDVLSGLFFVLTIGTYVWYVQKPFSWGRYLPLIAVYALGLMTKPMLVTLPLVLLLLDYWPLGRLAPAAAKDIPLADGGQGGHFSFPVRVVIEKVPLLLLMGVVCLVTAWTMREAARLDETFLPFSWRLANTLVSYVVYLSQLVWPVGLAVYYPHPGVDLPVWKVAGAAAVLAGISAAALAGWRWCPYLLVGWLWFLGMLVPVIGLVQLGSYATADRFTYLPQLGLGTALAWGVTDVCRRWPPGRLSCAASSALVLALLMGCAWRQTSFWCNSETLWTHALACTSRNSVAHDSLGTALAKRGQFGEALAHHRQALEIKPDCAIAHNNVALALTRLGQPDEALAHFRQALASDPDYAIAHNNLGVVLQQRGKVDEALAHFQQAAEINPDFAEAHNNLGMALQIRGRVDEALAQFQRAVELKPDYAEAHCNLGNLATARGQLGEAIVHYQKGLETRPGDVRTRCSLGVVLARCGRFDESIAQFEQALRSQPNCVEAHHNLAWLRATCQQAWLRSGVEAVEHARRADQLCSGKRVDVLDTLAAAYAEAGRFADALTTARKALDLATRQNAPALVDLLRTQISLYEAGKPFHQAPPKR